MKKLFILAALISLTASVFVMSVSARTDDLPIVEFLGDGPGSFQTTLDDIIVKVPPFDFVYVIGQTYTASTNERVWGVSGANQAPPAEWHQTVDLGPVQAGCISNYVGIDDDIDDRINSFELNGQTIETVTQGMVFSGSFVIPFDGNLTFIANDSVGGWFTACDDVALTATPRPTDTATPTFTPSPTATETNTPSPSPTATETGTPGPSPTATETGTPGPSPTATETGTPGPSPTATETNTPGPSPTIVNTPGIPTVTTTALPPTPEDLPPTRPPREDACTRINFEVSGDEAVRGLYVVQETGGRQLASWYALDGWQDSGWFKDIDISHQNVYVQVLYYPGPDTTPTVLTILNHAPDSADGWMSWGMCHALEVGWPD
ncbi:MAG: hypothetical protein ACK2U5_01620 [Candidatus Promineifilaceae bacterium]|jgi:hypothetical protein